MIDNVAESYGYSFVNAKNTVNYGTTHLLTHVRKGKAVWVRSNHGMMYYDGQHSHFSGFLVNADKK